MVKKFICLLAVMIAASAMTLFAQESVTKASEGTLILEKKTYPLKHAFACIGPDIRMLTKYFRDGDY